MKNGINKKYSLLQFIIGTVMISFSAVFVKLTNVGPVTTGFYRMLFGGVMLVVILLLKRTSVTISKKQLFYAICLGVTFAADLSFWHRSIDYVGPGLATILGNFQIFFISAFAVLFLKEKIGWKYILSVPLALLGLMLIVGFDWLSLEYDYRLGVIYGLATAICYAIFVIILKRAQSDKGALSPVLMMTAISLTTAAVLGIEIPIVNESFIIPDTISWISLLGYGFCGQVLGWVLITRAIPSLKASQASIILLLQPTLAFIWDILFFNRPTSILELIGAVVVIFAIYLGTRNNKI